MEKIHFEETRQLYPGVKRGLETEFKNFQKHKDWKEVLPLLKPAVIEQIERRKSNIAQDKFVPSWKHFKTWINQRCWEESEGGQAYKQNSIKEKARRRVREQYQDYFEYQSLEKLKELRQDPHLAYMAGWLIDEIINKRAK